jgi:hypothetical protein
VKLLSDCEYKYTIKLLFLLHNYGLIDNAALVYYNFICNYKLKKYKKILKLEQYKIDNNDL